MNLENPNDPIYGNPAPAPMADDPLDAAMVTAMAAPVTNPNTNPNGVPGVMQSIAQAAANDPAIQAANIAIAQAAAANYNIGGANVPLTPIGGADATPPGYQVLSDTPLQPIFETPADVMVDMVRFATEPVPAEPEPITPDMSEVGEVELGGGDEKRKRLVSIRFYYHDGHIVDVPVDGGFVEPAEDFKFWVDVGRHWVNLHPMSPVRSIEWVEIEEEDSV